MTPMIDVVFLLIIFFLVSSHLAKQETSLDLDLPLAESSLADVTEVNSLVVNVLASGQWQIAGSEFDEPQLLGLLTRRSLAAADGLRLKIRTDREVPYGRLEPILRSAAAAGIGDIVFSVYDKPAAN